MKKVSIKDIRDINPCYDPGKFKYFKEEWEGTALDVLRASEAGVAEEDFAADRLFVVLRTTFIDEKTLLLFAVWLLRGLSKLAAVQQPAVETALETAERFAHGKASRGAFKKAWSAAGYPDWDPSMVFMVAKEAWRVASWKKQRDKLIEMLEAYEK